MAGLTRDERIDAAVAAGLLLTDRYAVYLGDCVEVMQGFPDESVDFSVYSPPFGGMLYQYSSDPADLSNAKDYAEFFDHYSFVVREKHRLTKPGRMSAVHCTDIMAGMGDRPHLIDFPGDLIRCHEANGWKFIARYFVWKEPLMVRNRTMVKSLHHKTLTEDSTRCSMANADCLLIFRRSGENAVPVSHPTGLTNYAGSRQPPEDTLRFRGYKGDQISNTFSQWCWRQYASAFWDDVRPDRTLGSGASLYKGNTAAKDEPDEKHMHPLQLDVIERAVVMWSNPGETVLTPFMGVGSEVVGSLMNGRRAVGVELKPAYFRQALGHLMDATTSAAVEPDRDAPAKPITESSSEWETKSMLDLQEVEHADDTALLGDLDDPPASFLTDTEPAFGMSVSGVDPLSVPVPASTTADAPTVTEVYADGGCVLVNPSPHGGTWAWCHVAGGGRVREASGTVTPEEVGLPTVSNNVTEYLALLLCLEALPDGWSGKVFTDSGVTLGRFRDYATARTKGLPDSLVKRCGAVLARLGSLEYVLLGGHPTKADLGKGFRSSDGKPVSVHNKWCDRACGERAKELTPTPAEA